MIIKKQILKKVCPKCGMFSKYERTLSGTEKCHNPKCDYEISVGKITKIDLDRMRHNGR